MLCRSVHPVLLLPCHSSSSLFSLAPPSSSSVLFSHYLPFAFTLLSSTLLFTLCLHCLPFALALQPTSPLHSISLFVFTLLTHLFPLLVFIIASQSCSSCSSLPHLHSPDLLVFIITSQSRISSCSLCFLATLLNLTLALICRLYLSSRS